MHRISYRTFSLLLLVLCFAGCGGGSSDQAGSGSGTLNVSMVDSATDEYKAVYVTIKEVQAHREGSDWTVVSRPGKTCNLLDLVNGVRESLAITSLAQGRYTEMRLVLDDSPDNGINTLSVRHPYANYCIDKDDNTLRLRIPSGFQTGIKIVRGFEIRVNETTELVLDFDVNHSIVRAGNSGQWLLSPVIKMLETKTCSIVGGTITATATGRAVPGALVSAQVYDPNAAVESRVTIEAATITDDTGTYRLFLEPGAYYIVACKDGYKASYIKIVAETGNVYDYDLTLTTAITGSLSGNVTIAGAGSEQYETIQILQDISTEGNPAWITIKSFNIANQQSYETILPEGELTAIGSSYGQPTSSQSISITPVQSETADF